MKVWIDLFSGDEMVSDSYKHQLIMNDAALEVKAKYVTKGNDNIKIASDDLSDEEGGETVVNVVEAHGLQETQLSKKDFMALVKPYLKKTSEKLKEIGKEDRIPGFKAGATELVKFIVGRFDEFQIYCGTSFDTDAGLGFSYTIDGEEDPTFLFFADGMKEEKF